MPRFSAERLVETEYAALGDPQFVRKTRFGRFICDPRFPSRYDANQLIDCSLDGASPRELLDELETLYAGTALTFRKLTGTDWATFEGLRPLFDTVPDCEIQWSDMMVQEKPSARPINSKLQVEFAGEDRWPLCAAIHQATGQAPQGSDYQHARNLRLGAKTILGTFDGTPAGTTGWYFVGGLARFSRVATAPEFQKRGVASTLIQFVARQEEVLKADALVIFVAERGPRQLYEQLGFRSHARTWEIRFSR